LFGWLAGWPLGHHHPITVHPLITKGALPAARRRRALLAAAAARQTQSTSHAPHMQHSFSNFSRPPGIWSETQPVQSSDPPPRGWASTPHGRRAGVLTRLLALRIHACLPVPAAAARFLASQQVSTDR